MIHHLRTSFIQLMLKTFNGFQFAHRIEMLGNVIVPQHHKRMTESKRNFCGCHQELV